jgi:hypothetical protein
MADAPDPITSPPPVPGQPYDATESGGSVASWKKVGDGGAARPDGTAVPGDWPGNGASGDGGWQQT